MKRTGMAIAATLLLAGMIGLIGCASQQDGTAGLPESDPASSSTDTSTRTDPEVAKALSQLSPEDRAAAEEQKVCPVTDEQLGSMGKPVKVTVKDRDVYLCCEGCRETIESDPDKFLAKLK